MGRTWSSVTSQLLPSEVYDGGVTWNNSRVFGSVSHSLNSSICPETILQRVEGDEDGTPASGELIAFFESITWTET